MKPKLTTLKTGLRLLAIPMPQMESVTVMIAVGAGSRNETRRVNGLFHFIEHMAFKGTKKRPTSLKIASEIDGIGGQFNAFTDKETTGYFIKLASKHTELAFDLLSDMLQNSLFEEKEIEKEKGVIIEEINMYEDIPPAKAERVFLELLYGDNAMGWDIGGTKEAIKGIKREDFLKFQKQFYFSSNMVLVVAGKLEEGKIKNLAEKYFFQLRREGNKRTNNIKLCQNESRIKLVSKETEQAHFCLGVPGFPFSHKNRYPLSVLASVLGGGLSSRLSQEIREKRGLAYYLHTHPEFHTDSGYLFTQSGVRLDKFEEAVKVVLGEYERLARKKVAAKELVKAKEYLKGGLILGLEDSQQVANRFVYQALLGEKLKTPKETLALLDKVTAEDVQKTAIDLFKTKNYNLAIVGPYQNESRLRKLLKG